MAKTILIDSWAIVAALRKRDQHHAWAKSHFEAFPSKNQQIRRSSVSNRVKEESRKAGLYLKLNR